MSEIWAESVWQAGLQIVFTIVEGLPGNPWSATIRIGGIGISLLSIMYVTTTDQMREEFNREPALKDYVCYPAICCCGYDPDKEYNINIIHII